MLKSFSIKGCLYRTKITLRNFPPVHYANRVLKARQLREGRKKLASYYGNKAGKLAFKYHEQDAIDEFKRRLSILKPHFHSEKTGEMRVFWVGANRDQDESGFLQGLRRIATVVEFHNWNGTYGQWFWDDNGYVSIFDPAVIALNDESLKSQIKDALKYGAIDLLMGQMWANYISKEALEWVRSLGIPVINISMDDRLPDNWRIKNGVRLGAVGLASVTDIVLTTSSETCCWYGVEGCPAIFWPLASDPVVFSPVGDLERDIDVLFIGNKYGIRESIIKGLTKRGVDVECYGAGWSNGPATAEESATLFKRAKIILGVGTVGYCDDVFTLKLRDFDAPMSGGLYITHRNIDLAELYIEGEEIECYETLDECAQKIKKYIRCPELLEKISMHGHEKALSRDTWDNRLNSTFSTLGLINSS